MFLEVHRLQLVTLVVIRLPLEVLLQSYRKSSLNQLKLSLSALLRLFLKRVVLQDLTWMMRRILLTVALILFCHLLLRVGSRIVLVWILRMSNCSWSVKLLVI
jgi:hypothetical protein